MCSGMVGSDCYRRRADERRPRCGQTKGPAVEMTLELDKVVDADPTYALLGKIGLRRERVEVGPIGLFEEHPPGDAELRIRRSSLSSRNNSLIAAFSSARLRMRSTLRKLDTYVNRTI